MAFVETNGLCAASKAQSLAASKKESGPGSARLVPEVSTFNLFSADLV
jgi:hypothetical protein